MDSADEARPTSPSVSKLRSAIADARIDVKDTELRKTILYGAFNKYQSCAAWKKPSFKLLVFVSSTFTDTKIERDYLMDHLLFELREDARKHGIQVIFVDMRWGVRDESSSDHKTWIECSNAISWCKEESAGVCFLSLQGDKYGYTPLPKTILQSDLDTHLASTKCPEETRKQIFDWYVLDENAIPKEYALTNLKDLDDQAHWSAFEPMLAALSGVPFDTRRYPGLVVGKSVTEWEVRAACSNYPVDVSIHRKNDAEGNGGKVTYIESGSLPSLVWSHRQLGGTISDKLYCDTNGNDNTKDSLMELKMYMKENFADVAIESYKGVDVCLSDLLAGEAVKAEAAIGDTTTAGTIGKAAVGDDCMNDSNGSGNDDDTKRSSATSSKLHLYMEKYKQFVSTTLHASLKSIIQKKEQWARDGNGLQLSGDMLSEILHHSEWAHRKCSNFVGREKLVEQTMRFVHQPHRDQRFAGKYAGIAGCVVGVSGAGKTALMAKVASEVYSEISAQEQEQAQAQQSKEKNIPSKWNWFKTSTQQVPTAVLVRFCGTSPGSRNARTLMESICAQIEIIFGDTGDSKIKRRSENLKNEDYEHVVHYFQVLLQLYPVILFIDSLDQLTDEDRGRSQISFLKGLKAVHPDTRVIVSCLPDEVEINPETGRSYLYLCDTRLKEGSVPRVEVQMSTESPQKALDEAMEIVDALLLRRGRTLTDAQRTVMCDKVRVEKEKTALYINLAVGIVCNFTSVVDLESGLQGGVKPLIQQLYTSLERSFGAVLVRAALGFLTFASKGITDVEMEDLLSLHDGVLDFVFQYATPNIRRLPSHVWLRLKSALTDLVVEVEGGVLVWYHRQLKETAEEYFQAEKKGAHQLMAEYFGNLVSESTRSSRKITVQDWVVNDASAFEAHAIFNVRRCSEASHHLLQRGLYLKAEAELCNFEGICSKIHSGMGFELISEVNSLRQIPLRTLFAASDGNEFDDVEVVERHKERVEHYLRWLREDIFLLLKTNRALITFRATAQPMNSLVRRDMKALLSRLYQLQRDKKVSFEFPIGQTLPAKSNFGALLANIQYDDIVLCVAINLKGTHIASASADSTVSIWDASTGAHKTTLEGHSESVYTVAFSPDGNTLASGSYDTTIGVWDISTGSLILTLRGHSAAVKTVAFHPDGTTVASGSSDKTIRLWDVQSGTTKATFKGHLNCVTSVSFHPDGKQLVSGAIVSLFSSDKTICVWNTETGSMTSMKTSSLKTRARDVTSVAFSPDGSQVVSSATSVTRRDEDQYPLEYTTAVHLWDVETRDVVAIVATHENDADPVAFSPDGSQIAYTSMDKIILWDTRSCQVTTTLTSRASFCRSVVFSANGATLIAGTGRVIDVWDATVRVEASDHTHTMFPKSVAFSPDAKKTISAARNTVSLWDAETGHWEASLIGADDSESMIYCIALSPDGNLIAGCGSKGKIRIWNVKTKELVSTFQDPSFYDVYQAAFSTDSTCLVTVAYSLGLWSAPLRVWDMETNTLKASLKSPEETHCIAVSTDGSNVLIATGTNNGNVYIWNMPVAKLSFLSRVENNLVGKWVAKLKGHKHCVISVSFNSDGTQILTRSAGRILIFNIATRAQTGDLKIEFDPTFCTALFRPTPNANQFVCVSTDGISIYRHDSMLKKLELISTMNTKEYSTSMVSASLSPVGDCLFCGLSNGNTCMIQLPVT